MVLMLLGCLAHHAPVRATTPTPVDLVAVLASVSDPAVTGPTDTLSRALTTTLVARNLTPNVVSGDTYVTSFQATRDTRRRLDTLHATGPTLLVETETSFYSELSGRYRWVVHTTLSLAPSGLTDTFDVPVFLQFSHEHEAEAVDQAAPVIARHAGDLVDDWLSAKP